MKIFQRSNSLHAFALLVFCVVSHPALSQEAQYQVFNNGRLRFGTGNEASVNPSGNLQQPFYFDNSLNGYYRLTFSNYPLDNAIGIGGDGTNEWNVNGTIAENGALAGQTLDISGFTATSASTGYGTIVSTGTVNVGDSAMELRNTYVLGQNDSFVRITTRLTNNSGSTVSNVRVWVGTRDDYVGNTDRPTKTRGTLGANGFQVIPTASTRAPALQITSGQSGVLFYSDSPKAYTSINSCCDFENAYTTNPATSAITAGGDGSYALYVRMNDLANGASEEFTWYYAAGSLAQLATISTQVSGAASGNFVVTATAGANGSISPGSTTVAPGGTAQFTVTPNNGYRVDSVQGCDGSLATNVFTTGVINASCAITATFAIGSHLVTASAGTGGSITEGNVTVADGATTTFTIVPAEGYDIGTVSGCGGTLDGSTYTTGAITAACTVTATFNRRVYTVSTESVSSGTIAPSSAQVSHGDTATFTITPADGFSIASVEGCGGSLNGTTYTTSGVTSACSVVANFQLTAPTFQIEQSAVFEMNATELLTPLPAAARPRAYDYQGTELSVVLVNSQTRYPPGIHQLRWRTVDSRGVPATIDQTLKVWPTVNFGPDLSIGARAGNYDFFRIALNGRSPVYPFTVNYTVSGDVQGTDLRSGSVVFGEGEVEKQIGFAVTATASAGSPERTVQIALDDSLNRGSTRSLRVTLSTLNQAPQLNLRLSQADEERLVATRDSGPLKLTADIHDPDTNDTHTIRWNVPAGVTYTTNGDTIIVDPASVAPGVYRIELIVTDSGVPPTVTRRTFDVVVLATTPTLPGGATRLLANGLPDSPAYAPVAPNVLPERGGQIDHHLMEAEAGTQLSLGPYAMYRSAYQTELQGNFSAVKIPDDSVRNSGGYFDFVINNLPRVGESVSIAIPQRTAIPAKAVYRKYDPATNRWRNFAEDNDNRVASAPGADGYCPPPSSSEYRSGLNVGDWCVRLTIKDGGANDADGAVNGSVSDPGGVGTLSDVVVNGSTRGGGGGSFDWMLAIGVLCLLSLRFWRRRKALAAMTAVLAITATPANAEESNSWYAGAQFGTARSDVRAADLDAALLRQGYDVTSTINDRSRDAWRVHGGYDFIDVLGVEVGYVNLGRVDTDFTGAIADVNAFMRAANELQPPSAKGFDLTGVAHYTFSRLTVQARAGAFFWDARYITHNTDGRSIRRNDSGVDAVAGIGAQFNLFKQWNLAAEYTRYGIAGDHIDFLGAGVTVRW